MTRILRSSILALAVLSIASGQLHADELVKKLRTFLVELRSDYKPLLSTSHQFMINAYFRDRAIDQFVVLVGVQAGISASQQDARRVASRLAQAAIISEDIEAGNPPTVGIWSVYRDLFFDRYRAAQIIEDLQVYFRDGRGLVDHVAGSCSRPSLERVGELFAPERFYTNNVLTTVIPKSPDFSWNMTITFRSDGTLESIGGGVGEPGQQLPGGYSAEEHAIAWGGGAAAATAVNAATGVALTASTAAATGVGLVVVAVAYAVMAALKHADKVKAIHEQAALMEEADKIHEETITFIREQNFAWIQEHCHKQKSLNADSIAALATFLTTSESVLGQMNELSDDVNTTYSVIERYIVQELNQPAPDNLVLTDLRRAIDTMLSAWTTKEQEARDFWANNISAALMPPDATRSQLPDGLFPKALEDALDSLTLGDCRFAQCYPTFGQEVPVENEHLVSLAWLYLRTRAGTLP